MLMQGLQSSILAMVPSLSDCTCSSIHRQREPSYLRPQLHRMSTLQRTRMWPLRRAWVDFHSYTSIMADVPFIAPNPVDREPRSIITLLISVVQRHRLHHSEEAPHLLLSSMKAVMPPPMPNWLQWMSIISLMAGMHPIHILLPLEILGHLVLTQISTHVILKECVARLLLTTRTTVVPLALGPYPLLPLFMLVALVHQLIMVILPVGSQSLQALQALIALLMRTPGSQVVTVCKVIGKSVGIVVSGNGVGTRVDGMQHISMGHLRHLEP